MEDFREVTPGPYIIPYLASLDYYRGVARGERSNPGPFNRARLAPDLLLTVPVVGGSGAIKRLAPERLEISQHGRWQHVHLGALEARLGRTPFWRHLEPDVAPLIANASGLLSELNSVLDQALRRFLDFENLIPELREFARRNPDRLAALAARYLRNVDPAAPLLVSAAHLGRNAIFTLAPPLLSYIPAPAPEL